MFSNDQNSKIQAGINFKLRHEQAAEKQESGRQARRAAIRQAQHIRHM